MNLSAAVKAKLAAMCPQESHFDPPPPAGGAEGLGAGARQPLGHEEFRQLVGALAPGRRIAVAVSGGADSTALALLTARWAEQSHADVTAITIDHGLRPESATEAALVGAWMQARGIRHRTLHWDGAKPSHGIQAAARDARYRLLTAWCRDNGGADLLLAHHAGDQSETFAMRLGRASGPLGLAGIGAVVERDGIRLLRPVLSVERARLVATLWAAGQPWIEDPSNANPRFARVATRQRLAALAAVAPEAPHALALAAQAFGAVRATHEAHLAVLLAEGVTTEAAGNCRLDATTLAMAPPALAHAAVAHILTVVGGQPYAPAQRATKRLLGWLLSPASGARTLHGCVVRRRRDGGADVCREARNLPRVAIATGERIVWDGRFIVKLTDGDPTLPYQVASLGDAAADEIRGRGPRPYPAAVVRTLPALFQAGRLLAVPHLGFSVRGEALDVMLRTRQTLAFRPFAVVSGAG